MFSESLCTRSAKLEEKTRLRSRLAAAIVAFEKNGHGRRMGEARRGEKREREIEIEREEPTVFSKRRLGTRSRGASVHGTVHN